MVLCGCKSVLSVFHHCYTDARMFQLVARVLLSCSECFLSWCYVVYYGAMQLQQGFGWLPGCHYAVAILWCFLSMLLGSC